MAIPINITIDSIGNYELSVQREKVAKKPKKLKH